MSPWSTAFLFTLITVTKFFTQFHPEVIILVQGPHQEELVAVEDVFPVSHSVEQMEGLCSVASRQNTVSVSALYEGLTLHTIVGHSLRSLRDLERRLEDLVNIDVEAAQPSTVVRDLVFPLLHIDDVEPGGQRPALLLQLSLVPPAQREIIPAAAAGPLLPLLAHLKREQ